MSNLATSHTSTRTHASSRDQRRLPSRLLIALALSIAGIVGVVTQTEAATAPLFGPITGAALFSAERSGAYLCTVQMMRRDPSRCPPYGPSARQVRLAFLRAQLPNPLPTLDVEEIEATEDAITPFTFAYVRVLPAPTYRHPEEAAVDLPPVRQFLAGDNWVTIIGSLDYQGELWYEINLEEYVRAEHLAISQPSRFSGVMLGGQPVYPFGWINRDVYTSDTPGSPPGDQTLLRRYDLITMYAQEPVGAQLWYMVGPDQWVEQSVTSRVDAHPVPEGVGPDEKWIEINTFEQTLAAYEGERMVFATLVSTGRTSTWTPNGLTRIWGKLPSTPMRNQDVGPDSAAWYYLENVEWTQYFNGAYALHAAYWHNSFGFTRSHGCVNLAILDAKWLFDWTTPSTPHDARIVTSHDGDVGTWVWVHMTPPSPNIVVTLVQ